MADSNEDDHFKTSDHTNHKPSPDQVPHLFFFFLIYNTSHLMW